METKVKPTVETWLCRGYLFLMLALLPLAVHNGFFDGFCHSVKHLDFERTTIDAEAIGRDDGRCDRTHVVRTDGEAN